MRKQHYQVVNNKIAMLLKTYLILYRRTKENNMGVALVTLSLLTNFYKHAHSYILFLLSYKIFFWINSWPYL